MTDDRKLVLSVKASDCTWEYFPAGKNGGQNGNKNSTACRVTHPPSGARGESREHKSQLQNRKAAWRRMVESEKFQLWLKLQTGRFDSVLSEMMRRVNNKVERDMREENIVVEYYDPEETP